MPYTYSIAPDERLARIRLLGAVEGREITAAWQAVVSDPTWERGFASLWDATGINLHILMDDIEAFAAQASESAERRGPGRTAIVADDVSVHINALLLCLKSKGGDEREFRVFQRIADAEAWLAEHEMALSSVPAESTEETPVTAPMEQWDMRSGYLVRVATHPEDRPRP